MADDLDEFARLWREEPSQEESEAFRQLAGKAARRARLAGYAELGTTAVIGAAILMALLVAKAALTVAIGMVLLVVLVWSARKRHMLRQVAIIISSSDGGSLVEKEIVKTRADLRRTTIGLFLYPPAVPLGHMLVNSVATGGSLENYWEVLVQDLTGGPVGWWLAALFALFLAYQLSAIFRLKRELRRLEGLRVEYEEELRLDALGGEGLTH